MTKSFLIRLSYEQLSTLIACAKASPELIAKASARFDSTQAEYHNLSLMTATLEMIQEEHDLAIKDSSPQNPRIYGACST